MECVECPLLNLLLMVGILVGAIYGAHQGHIESKKIRASPIETIIITHIIIMCYALTAAFCGYVIGFIWCTSCFIMP